MTTKIVGGTVVTGGREERADLYFTDGRITAIGLRELPYDTLIRADGCYVSPGFIDIHTHGAGGSDFLDGTAEAFLCAAQKQAQGGATTVVATVTSSTYAEMERAVAVFEQLRGTVYDGAQIAGLHFEGPYFALSQKGAQDAQYIKPFLREEYESIVSSTDCILRWSAAPELPGAKAFAACMRQHGILASIGHSDAESTRVREAFAEGFTHVTHLYSCTSTVHRRNAFRYAGIVEAAYLLDDMTVEIIADGIHLPPDLLRLVYKIKGAEHTVLVTDSMRGAGMPNGKSILGSLDRGMEVILEDGVAKLPDRSAFAGSVALCNRLVKNMVTLADVELPQAVRMMTETPAKVMKLEKKGSLISGYDADITIFDPDFNVRYTICGGRTVYCREKEGAPS